MRILLIRLQNSHGKVEVKWSLFRMSSASAFSINSFKVHLVYNEIKKSKPEPVHTNFRTLFCSGHITAWLIYDNEFVSSHLTNASEICC